MVEGTLSRGYLPEQLRLMLRCCRYWMAVAVSLSVVLWSTLAGAELVAVGERSSQTYRLGVALGAVITLGQESDRLTFNILPAKDQNVSPIKPLLDRIANFALVEASLLDTGKHAKAELAKLRGVAVLTRTKGEPTFLITHEEVAERQVGSVARAILTDAGKLMVLYEATASLKPAPVLATAGLKLHQGALELYGKEGKTLYANGLEKNNEPNSDGSEPHVIDAALTPSSHVEPEIEAEIRRLGRERDSFATELQASLKRQESLTRRLGEMESVQRTAQSELDAVQLNLSEREAAEGQLRSALDAITQQRDGAVRRLSKLEQRVTSVEFTSLEEASGVAVSMRERAELVEARYREAYEIGKSCLQQHSGGTDKARTALRQIERLEAELQQITEDHRQCLVGQNR